MDKIADFHLPWLAQPCQRTLTANVLVNTMREELETEGIEGRVDRFVEEYGGVPDSYEEQIALKFGAANIPSPVKGLLAALKERISDLKTQHKETSFTDEISSYEVSVLAAKMAVTIAEVRALNEVLGR